VCSSRPTMRGLKAALHIRRLSLRRIIDVMKELIVALIAFTALMPPRDVNAQSQTAQIRKTRASRGHQLADLIRPGEPALIVESGQDRPLEVLPGPEMSTMQWFSKIAHAIVVADVLAVDPKLTESEDWITSRVTASVIEVFKTSAAWNPRAGDEFSFTQDGGELLIGAGTHVTAVIPWAKPVQAGKRYLIFASVDPETKRVIVGPTSTYEIRDSRLIRLAPSGYGPDDIEKDSEANVRKEIREAVAALR